MNTRSHSQKGTFVLGMECMALNPVLVRLRQKDNKIEASMGNKEKKVTEKKWKIMEL